MEEKMILISSSKMEALIRLMKTCVALLGNDTDHETESQRLTTEMLTAGIPLVKKIVEDGQKKEGGAGL